VRVERGLRVAVVVGSGVSVAGMVAVWRSVGVASGCRVRVGAAVCVTLAVALGTGVGVSVFVAVAVVVVARVAVDGCAVAGVIAELFLRSCVAAKTAINNTPAAINTTAPMPNAPPAPVPPVLAPGVLEGDWAWGTT
jgi:hypothetical protein